MFRQRVPSDVVKAVFYYLGQGMRFSANIPKIHQGFYTICGDANFKSICSDFVFDTSKVFPFSPTIGYALDRLQKADLLACRNPGLDEYEVTEELGRQHEEIESLFDEKERILLEEGAKIFQRVIRS